MVEQVSLYRPPDSSVANADEIAEWLHCRIDAEVRVRERFLSRWQTDTIPEQFASARVLDPYNRETGNTMLGIVRYEERALENPAREGGVLYDGLAVQRALNDVLPESETSLDHTHVALLDRALGTWGDHDGRWHKRVNVLGQPALVSVPGLYEAPAKPERYYREKQKHAMFSGDAPPREVLENQVDGEFLVENDPRTTEALKGYVLQAIHYIDRGKAFCENEQCRLFNAHRQEELVEAQLREPEFCDTHREEYGGSQDRSNKKPPSFDARY